MIQIAFYHQPPNSSRIYHHWQAYGFRIDSGVCAYRGLVRDWCMDRFVGYGMCITWNITSSRI